MKKKHGFSALLARFRATLSGNTQLLVGLILVFIMVALAILAPVLSPYDPYALTPEIMKAPGTPGANGAPTHWLGTDKLGRDILSQMLWGAQTSLKIGFIAALIAAVVGTLIGGIAGYFGGRVDKVIVEFINIFVMTPSFFLILIIVAMFGSRMIYVMIVIGLTSWPGNARLMRAQAISLRNRTFSTSCQAMGESRLSIMFRHIIPNGIFPIVANTTMQISGAILTEAGLSFLGLGDPNIVSWGQMISSGKSLLTKAPWVAIIPGVAVVLNVLAFFLIGDGLNRVIAPKMNANK